METVRGKISAIDDRGMTVKVRSAISCKRCAAGNGCGAGIFQSSNDLREIRMRRPAGFLVGLGDSVELSIEPKNLLRASILAYGLPLASMLLVLATLQALPLVFGEAMLVGFAFMGLVLGVLIGRRILSNDSVCTQFVPTVSDHANRRHD